MSTPSRITVIDEATKNLHSPTSEPTDSGEATEYKMNTKQYYPQQQQLHSSVSLPNSTYLRQIRLLGIDFLPLILDKLYQIPVLGRSRRRRRRRRRLAIVEVQFTEQEQLVGVAGAASAANAAAPADTSATSR